MDYGRQFPSNSSRDVGAVTAMEDLAIKLIATIVGTGISFTLFYLLRQIIRGELVPRATLRDAQEERNVWRASAEVRSEQTQKLIDQYQITNDLLESLKKEAEESRKRA